MQLRKELYEKARRSVKEDGYNYKKGYSRSGEQSSSSSEQESFPKEKRVKFDSDERRKEAERLSKLLENVHGHLKIKKARIDKAMAVKDCKLCDQISTEVRQLLKKKAEYERQISAIQRKEKKASWFSGKKSISKISLTDISQPESQTQNSITAMFNSDLAKKSINNVSSQPSMSATETLTASSVLISESSKGNVPRFERSESNSSHDTLIIQSSGGEQDF